MRKQKLNPALDSTLNAQDWIRNKTLEPLSERNQKHIHKSLTYYFQYTFKSIRDKFKNILLTSLKGQVILPDEIIREGSFLFSFNFLGTPQALFLLPNTYRLGSVSAFENNTGHVLKDIDVQVLPLVNCRFELVLKGKPEKLRINIYNDCHQLVFSEQLNFKGSYNGIYRVNPFKTGGIYFEVVSKEGRFHSQQL